MWIVQELICHQRLLALPGTVSMADDRTDAAEVNDVSTQTEQSLEQITDELAELKLKFALYSPLSV